MAKLRPLKVVKFLERFIHTESSSGALLFLSAIVAIVWANSSAASLYHHILEAPVRLQIGGFLLDKTVHHFINDALMAIFFLVVGLEIKRELLIGELSSVRQAMLPIVAALGGMVAPALIYLFIAEPGVPHRGWAIPTATDIAFSLAVLAVLGSRVSTGLKVMLTALAIVDDLGAVIVIAIFYTSQIELSYLATAAALYAVLIALNRSGVRHTIPYLLLGVFLWYAVYMSGVHATVAGVLLAFTIPLSYSMTPATLVKEVRHTLSTFDVRHLSEDALTTADKLALDRFGVLHRESTPPLESLIHRLHPWVAFLIMPLFALANSGLTIEGDFLASLSNSVSLGIAAGLAVGKPLGIVSACLIASKLGIAALPRGTRFQELLGVGMLAGIGFTMSLFISGLAFEGTDLSTISKVGILTGSLISMISGYLVLRFTPQVAK